MDEVLKKGKYNQAWKAWTFCVGFHSIFMASSLIKAGT